MGDFYSREFRNGFQGIHSGDFDLLLYSPNPDFLEKKKFSFH
jgi:hypothetical protein